MQNFAICDTTKLSILFNLFMNIFIIRHCCKVLYNGFICPQMLIVLNVLICYEISHSTLVLFSCVSFLLLTLHLFIAQGYMLFSVVNDVICFEFFWMLMIGILVFKLNMDTKIVFNKCKCSCVDSFLYLVISEDVVVLRKDSISIIFS